MHHATTIVPDIVYSRTLARIKTNTETPLLPLDQGLVCDAKRRALRLYDIQGLQIPPSAVWQKLWDVVGGLAMSDNVALEGLLGQTISLAASRRTIHSNDLLGKSVHDRDQWQGVGVEVRIRVILALVGSKTKTLEVPPILFSVVQATIGPWLDCDLKSWRQVKIFQGFLEQG